MGSNRCRSSQHDHAHRRSPWSFLEASTERVGPRPATHALRRPLVLGGVASRGSRVFGGDFAWRSFEYVFAGHGQRVQRWVEKRASARAPKFEVAVGDFWGEGPFEHISG